MEKEPLVSVGIPCYNRPEGLRRTLECITGQSYRNLEIIVSDNFSPNPDVERIGREFANKDKRIRYVRQIENFGVDHNFQFVLGEANGMYFMWACDDDTFSFDYIKKCINRIGSHGCCVTNTVNIKTDGKIYSKYLVDKIEYFESDYRNFLHFLNRISAGYFYALYKRECLSKCLRDESDYFNGMCEYLALYIYIYCGMIELQEDLYFKLESEDNKNDQIIYMKYYDKNRDFLTYNLKMMELINNHHSLSYFEKVDLIIRLLPRLLGNLSRQLFNPKSIALRIWMYITNFGIKRFSIKCQELSR